ncbi:hypothetical protein [Vibrio mimicus]|nr:hypothetical protein [Vibrio mimicus]
MTKIKNIAIIGAGPSGLSEYLQLVKEQHTDLASSLTNTSVGVTSLY